ncbi:MAG TPA: cytochrome c-type biogenesis CcmF C-terminal domain-containing protein, partial [Acidimicrobiia bacterium]|nr:cytochrome c-type biogenesis CcmF C-terminal domain-containing protein [Acidimicrobiia bacterium]
WGGYWAWDPVENASFLPWLTATAFLHSAMVQERRSMLRVWNLNLIVGTFALTILGTFLTRSGIISSVHAFTTGTIGYYFLTFIALVLLTALAIVAGNSERLRTKGRLDSAASRETVFLLNNLFLTAFMLTVLVGTLFPLVAEAVRGVKVSVGGPFFNRMSLPLIAALLFLMGVGPALPWKAATRAELKTKLVPPASGAAVLAVIAILMGIRNPYGLVVFAFVGYSAAANLREFWFGARARHTAHSEAWQTAIVRLIASNRRRYGGYIAHFGVFFVALGITASSSLRTENEATLKPGETLTISGRTVRLKELWGREEKQRSVVGATVEVLDGGKVSRTLEPRMNFYPTQQEPVPTPDVRSGVFGDLYLNLVAFRPDGSTATIKAIYEPLLPWIWFGGGVVVFGAIVSGWPTTRRRTVIPVVLGGSTPERDAA